MCSEKASGSVDDEVELLALDRVFQLFGTGKVTGIVAIGLDHVGLGVEEIGTSAN
jgi:hypothetical protein